MRGIRPCRIPAALLGAAAILMFVVAHAAAQDTLLINYQGYLTDISGDPVNGNVIMTFSIYDAGGVSQWTETHGSVEVASGLFGVVLGSESALPATVFDGSLRYLGIQVGTDVEMSPRTLMTSAPGAAVARRMAGDLHTAPGLLVLKDASGDSSIVLSADAAANAMKITWGSPPNDQFPAFEVVSDAAAEKVTMGLAAPPDDITPGIELAVDALTNTGSFRIGAPPDDSHPSFEVVSDAATEKVTMGLSFPPDPYTPGIELAVDALTNTGSFRIASPPDDTYPSFEVVCDAAAEKVTMGLGAPPDDQTPGIELAVDALTNTGSFRIASPPDDNYPAIQLSSDDTEALLAMQGLDANSLMEVGVNSSAHLMMMDRPGTVDSSMLTMRVDSGQGSRIELEYGESAAQCTGSIIAGSQDGAVLTAMYCLASDGAGVSQRTAKWDSWAKPDQSAGSDYWMQLPVESGESSFYSGLAAGLGKSEMSCVGISPRGDSTAVVVTVNDTMAEVSLFEGTTSDPPDIVLRTTNADDGRVGINTDSPSEALYVVGNIVATGTITELSDGRLKENVTPVTDALDKISKLRGVNFEWHSDESDEMRLPKGRQIGVIAQEVERVLPEVVNTPDDGYKSVDYGKLTAVLIEAVKEQQQTIDELKAQLEELSAEVRK
ncbi:MAG: tail fiber domain-containing protein [Candidatus Zixiibacteriota bacterium]|nr:MAG: tail fiber domain-containing protein [candidate division Zixibacteria bacterium]